MEWAKLHPFEDTETFGKHKQVVKVNKNLAFQEAKHLIAEHKLNQSDIIYITYMYCYVGVFSEV